jgi:hypothetical protein
MKIPLLYLMQNVRKPNSRQIPGRPHLMLAGIHQKVFLNQWGEPEAQVGLSQIGKLNKLGTLFLITDPNEETHLSVWIYKKKDRILCFTREKLISHFSCKKYR